LWFILSEKNSEKPKIIFVENLLIIWFKKVQYRQCLKKNLTFQLLTFMNFMTGNYVISWWYSKTVSANLIFGTFLPRKIILLGFGKYFTNLESPPNSTYTYSNMWSIVCLKPYLLSSLIGWSKRKTNWPKEVIKS